MPIPGLAMNIIVFILKSILRHPHSACGNVKGHRTLEDSPAVPPVIQGRDIVGPAVLLGTHQQE